MNNTIVIIRSVGERTEQLCQKLILKQDVPEKNIITIHESPFTAALRKSFHIGIEKGKKWTLCVDADVLLRPNSIAYMIEEFESQPENVCEIQGYVLDKFFGGPREAGFHLYRTSLLNKLISHTPTYHQIRPESATLQATCNAGYPFVKVPYLVGLHDFEQYYKDIFRKCFVQAHKHLYRSELLLTIFREGMKKDQDFKVALDGFVAGLYYCGEVKIDIRQEIYQQSFSELLIDEKGRLNIDSWGLEKIETIIANWNEPSMFKKHMKFSINDLQIEYEKQMATRKGFVAKTKYNIDFLKEKLSQQVKSIGLLQTALYIIGYILGKLSDILIKSSQSPKS